MSSGRVRGTQAPASSSAGDDGTVVAGSPSQSRIAVLVHLISGLDTLERPPESLDPLIDATERVVSRYGILRTSMSDLAREMNVARSTLYRQVDSVNDALVLTAARVVYRFLDDLITALMTAEAWSDGFVDAVIKTVSLQYDSPIVRRLVRDEPEVLGELTAQGAWGTLIRRSGEAVIPILEGAMAVGQMRRLDPRLAGESLARQVVMMMLSSPEGDLRETAEFMLAPYLPEVPVATTD
ncbi:MULTISPECIES: TetR/AcrR family transcriptional regulator [unclassified Mycobacteroides]|uniref:TetR/AcrR family transcriptional regulator n=1 Tax=unclassified Mycobacteroides TaxID=2618759 RepID=UPI00132BD526|nr:MULTISPECIES: helix-turn-helix domain-containing protein [unclassified Mycobacteroides]MUM19736.1 hypothetical protein [Mycobacteroides sp. CBMA 326]